MEAKLISIAKYCKLLNDNKSTVKARKKLFLIFFLLKTITLKINP